MPKPPPADAAVLPLVAHAARRPCRRRAACAALGVAALVAASSGTIARAAPDARPMVGAPHGGTRGDADATSSASLAAVGDAFTPVAHLGGRLRGLAVDGATAYVGDGVDVVLLRAEPDGQLTAVRRVPLPDVVTALALAAERDRLYATAGDAVYALDGALSQRPHVVDSAAVPLAPARTIAAQGDSVFVRVRSAGPERARCVAAVRFVTEPGHAEVGAPACQPVPDRVDEDAVADDVALGDGVLAVSRRTFDGGWYQSHAALFDVTSPARPRYVREVRVASVTGAVALFGRRLWIGTDTVRSYDLVGPDLQLNLHTEWSGWGWVHQFVAVDGEIWIASGEYGITRPSPSGEPDPEHDPTIWGCHGWDDHQLAGAARPALRPLYRRRLRIRRPYPPHMPGPGGRR